MRLHPALPKELMPCPWAQEGGKGGQEGGVGTPKIWGQPQAEL